MVPIKGFEPPTFALRKHCSTPELNRHYAWMNRGTHNRFLGFSQGFGLKWAGFLYFCGSRAYLAPGRSAMGSALANPVRAERQQP